MSAEEVIESLLSLAEEATKKGEKDLARRYVYLARRVSMKHRERIRRERKFWMCRCGAYLVPGINCRVRVKNNWITLFCEECSSYKRVGNFRAKHM
jgi:ribonuclease P protein subunit RPR2